MSHEPADIRAFCRPARVGDSEAYLHFQEAYGEDIYNFPKKI